MFKKGDRVETPQGFGSVAYVRFRDGVPEAVSVVVDKHRVRFGYTGTIFALDQVRLACG